MFWDHENLIFAFVSTWKVMSKYITIEAAVPLERVTPLNTKHWCTNYAPLPRGASWFHSTNKFGAVLSGDVSRSVDESLSETVGAAVDVEGTTLDVDGTALDVDAAAAADVAVDVDALGGVRLFGGGGTSLNRISFFRIRRFNGSGAAEVDW